VTVERRRLPYPEEFDDPEGAFQPSMAPGQRAIVLAAVLIGLLLLSIQLWLLTVAVELYLGGEAEDAWTLAVVSALVFLGGLFAYRLLRHQPQIGPR
jgi:hypothetical protein